MQPISYILVFLFLSLSNLSFAQSYTADEAAIIQTIQDFFDGMRAGDSSAVRATLYPGVTLASTYVNQQGEHVVQHSDMNRFLSLVGTPHDEVWDEKIWSYDINVEDLLATAWTDYTFYIGEKLSHCGVNAFELFKSKEGWRILRIIDTRQKENCQTKPRDDEAAIHQLMDDWHQAATVADSATFFGSMTADGIYLGTDATEHWLRDSMAKWAAPIFQRDTAWAFTATQRNVYLAKDGKTAWFEEWLDTWMGVCRGTGVVQLTQDGWRIRHYHLAIAVPNDKVKSYLALFKN